MLTVKRGLSLCLGVGIPVPRFRQAAVPRFFFLFKLKHLPMISLIDLANLCLIKKPQRGGYRISRSTEVIESTAYAARFFRKIWDKKLLIEQEQVYVIYVTEDCTPIAWTCIHTGGICHTVLDVKLVMSQAIHYKANGIFIAHNHPSGKLRASQTDIDMTSKLLEACKLFDVHLYDHIILTSVSYLSFRESGLLD